MLMDLVLRLSGQTCDHVIRKFNPFCFFQKFRRSEACVFESLLHLYQDCDLINKPDINLRNLMDLLVSDALGGVASAITQIRRSSTTCKLLPTAPPLKVQ